MPGGGIQSGAWIALIYSAVREQGASFACTAIIDARIMMADGECPHSDRQAIAARGRELATKLWQRRGAL